MFKVKNKDIRMTSLTFFYCFIVDFGQVNVCWETLWKHDDYKDLLGSHHTENSRLNWTQNQLTGFFMNRAEKLDNFQICFITYKIHVCPWFREIGILLCRNNDWGFSRLSNAVQFNLGTVHCLEIDFLHFTYSPEQALW